MSRRLYPVDEWRDGQLELLARARAGATRPGRRAARFARTGRPPASRMPTRDA